MAVPLLAVAAASAACGPTVATPSAYGREAARVLPPKAEQERRPAAAMRNVYFGDLHVHSSWSLDAWAAGNQYADPVTAYRYGRGEAVTLPTGARLHLRAPLDFMAVTDHDYSLGDVQACEDPADPASTTATCRELRGKAGITVVYPKFYLNQFIHPTEICGTGAQEKCQARARHQWDEIQKNAEAFYEPGKFTTFIAFEWSGAVQGSDRGIGMIHRNVIFRGSRVPEWGGGALEMKHSPERLWEWLERACTGECEVMAIPHNSNYAVGVMFAPRNFDGTPFTRDILARRARFERLVEIHQIKGNSECSPGVGTTDEDCNFEQSIPQCKPGDRERVSNCAFAANFVRNGLKTGLSVEAQFGINPFKYGILSSTDTHLSSPGSTEENRRGPGGGNFGHGDVSEQPPSPASVNNPGGLAGVWADANTRDGIFDALKRRETFGTSGPRIRLRVFAGWQFAADLHRKRNAIEAAYRDGVPMGSDLPSQPPGGRAPRLLVWATKDANSASLQKIQIVKGWFDGQQTHERVYDAVCADGLTPDPKTHRCAPNGATVSLSDCSYSRDKGAAELSTTWTDPHFRPEERAFYYARVLENPTCRWSTYEAIAMKREPSASVPPVIQERAWSSPVWYTPPAR